MMQYAWHELIRRKGRATAAIMSYALATLVFSVLISLLQYSERNQYKTLYNTGTHFIAFSPVCCNLPLLKDETHEGFWANGSRSAVIPMELIDTIKALSSVRDVSPFLLFRFGGSSSKSEVLVGGFDPQNTISVPNTACSPNDVVTGRFVTLKDTAAVMLEESYALSHRLSIGSTVNIAGGVFSVIGIINAGIRPAKADLYLPFRQAQQLISRRTWNPIDDVMNIVLVESKDAQSHQQAVQEVSTILGKDKIVSSYSCHTPAAEAITNSRQLLWLGFIFISIFVAVQVVRNHYASIIERRREIGILQSMGWQRKRICRLLINEFLLHALIGGIAGIYLAVIVQVMLPAQKPSCHILCSLDSLGNTLAGVCFVLFVAAVSAAGFAFYFSRLQPTTNLKHT